jgi:hypothetical protein
VLQKGKSEPAKDMERRQRVRLNFLLNSESYVGNFDS